MHRALRPTLASAGYVAAVGALAAAGFVSDTTWLILLAAALALPASVAALPGYYLGYGLLALIAGANADHSSGAGVATAPGDVLTSTTAGNPGWFTVCALILGIGALILAALVNVVLVRVLLSRRRTQPGPGPLTS